MRVVTAKRTHEVAKGSAVRVTRPLVRIPAERSFERHGRRDAPGSQIEVLRPRRLLDADALEPEAACEGRSQLLQLGPAKPLALQTPTPELAPPRGHRRGHGDSFVRRVAHCQGTARGAVSAPGLEGNPLPPVRRLPAGHRRQQAWTESRAYGGGIRFAPACSICTEPRLGGLGPGATSETTCVWKFMTNTSVRVPVS